MLFQTARSGSCTYNYETNSEWLENEICDLNDHIQSDRISKKNCLFLIIYYISKVCSPMQCVHISSEIITSK